jgi:hypothetical protein
MSQTQSLESLSVDPASIKVYASELQEGLIEWSPESPLQRLSIGIATPSTRYPIPKLWLTHLKIAVSQEFSTQPEVVIGKRIDHNITKRNA